MYRTFLSWRYMRARRTNWIGISGIFVGVGALILILSIMTGFLEETRDTMRGSLADMILSMPSGQSDEGREAEEPAALVAALEADERIQAAAAQLVWFGLLIRDDGGTDSLFSDPMFSQRAGVKIVGIDLEDELEATELRAALEREPRYGSRVFDLERPFELPPSLQRRGKPRPTILLGEQLFRTHGLHRGQMVQLGTLTQNSSGDYEPQNREFVVAGSFRSKDNEMDLSRVLMEREELVRFLSGTPPGEAPPPQARRFSEVLIKLVDYERDAAALRETLVDDLVARGLLARHSDLSTWEELRANMLGAIENERVLMGIMLSLVLLVAGFTIFAILSMMVTEKRRDIGILTALGATPRGVMTLFLLIGFWDALVGASAGAAVGIWMALRIDSIEQWLSRNLGITIFDRDVYLFDHIPSVVEPGRVALIVLGAFACALVFAAIPAYKAASMHPLDALRHE
ncbi:MAG TPA: FtsX-like permease family protein [Planctomycetota bacterium]|nr:FtsX-like permease family protein [Planctomycetota bacterium]